jgi:biopolymer transport protein TolQ
MSRLAEAGIDEYELSFTAREGKPDAGSGQLREAGLENVHRTLKTATQEELSRAENRLSFLATSGSVSPFFGLLGTVWGVMTSFIAMGLQSSASLAVVAPGIAEALITTIAGLAVAIPSVIFYNMFQDRLRRLDDELAAFSGDLVNAFSRELMR